jgi:Kunitz/Bovine pancreatic trypsin inhibitor domain
LVEHGEVDDSCDEVIYNYRYNPALKMCVLFEYSGCGGSANRFESLKQCTKYCGAQNPTNPPGKCFMNSNTIAIFHFHLLPQHNVFSTNILAKEKNSSLEFSSTKKKEVAKLSCLRDKVETPTTSSPCTIATRLVNFKRKIMH